MMEKIDIFHQYLQYYQCRMHISSEHSSRALSDLSDSESQTYKHIDGLELSLS